MIETAVDDLSFSDAFDERKASMKTSEQQVMFPGVGISSLMSEFIKMIQSDQQSCFKAR